MTTRVPPDTPAKYLAADQCAARYGFSTRHWWRQVDGGKAPQPTRFGRCVRWSIDQLEKWELDGCPPVTRRGGHRR